MLKTGSAGRYQPLQLYCGNSLQPLSWLLLLDNSLVLYYPYAKQQRTSKFHLVFKNKNYSSHYKCLPCDSAHKPLDTECKIRRCIICTVVTYTEDKGVSIGPKLIDNS